MSNKPLINRDKTPNNHLISVPLDFSGKCCANELEYVFMLNRVDAIYEAPYTFAYIVYIYTILTHYTNSILPVIAVSLVAYIFSFMHFFSVPGMIMKGFLTFFNFFKRHFITPIILIVLSFVYHNFYIFAGFYIAIIVGFIIRYIFIDLLYTNCFCKYHKQWFYLSDILFLKTLYRYTEYGKAFTNLKDFVSVCKDDINAEN